MSLDSDGPRCSSEEEDDGADTLRQDTTMLFGQPSPTLRAQTLKCVNTLSGHHSGIRVIAVATNRVYTGSYDNTIKVWNLDNGRCEATLEGHMAWIRALCVHAREPLLFSGSDDGLIKAWRADSYVHLHDILPANAGYDTTPAPAESGGAGILALTVDYNNNWLIAGSYDSNIYVWGLPCASTPSIRLLHVLRGHRSAVRSLVCLAPFSTFSPPCLMSGSYDRTIKLWELAEEECRCAGSLGTRGSVWTMVVHDGLLLGAIGDSSIKVWRMDPDTPMEAWQQIGILSGHRGLVLALAVYKDKLISGSDDRCIRVWRMGSWECERTLTGHNGGVVGVCFIQGNLISASNDSFIKVWNTSGIQRPFTAK